MMFNYIQHGLMMFNHLDDLGATPMDWKPPTGGGAFPFRAEFSGAEGTFWIF